MINTILTGWNFVRFLRLFLGIAALAAYFSEQDAFMGFLGVMVTAQSVFNVGCCGLVGCSTNNREDHVENKSSESNEIIFEEVK